MLFKDICYKELWQPLCSVEPNHLCNFDRGYYVEQFCEIILNLDQVVGNLMHWLKWLVRCPRFQPQAPPRGIDLGLKS